uniref:Leucine-rich repeat-containing N-terminal plant-type domain-containing protein n=1 Tax=Setaria italica TaxID=4555 RepID=K3YYB0_SETIT
MSGELPPTLSNCTSLITIDFSSNNFSGGLKEVNFSNLPNLKTIDLMLNNFSGTIPKSIYSCINLTALRLSSNKFHGQLSERIGNLKSLAFLSLVDNSLTNITSALQILSSCRNLTTLLIGTNFKNEAMPKDDAIDGFWNLRVLFLNDCSLSGNIPLWLSKLTNLEMLLLYNNELTGPIPDWINSLIFLFHINMYNNSLTGEIPTALMSMPMLEKDKVAPKPFELPIYTRSRQYRMAISFSTMLRVGRNNLTGVIPEEIGQLKALVSLDLRSNKLIGVIPQSICNLSNLEALDLSGKHLTGTIPIGLNNLHFVSKFNISNNDLEGPIPINGQLITFPRTSFEGNPDLGGNVIRGSIPDSIGELKGLQELQLGHNNMSEELPSTLGNCTDLRSINLGCNYFSGELTGFNFSTLTNLKSLDLMRNNFNGTFPESIYSSPGQPQPCNQALAPRHPLYDGPFARHPGPPAAYLLAHAPSSSTMAASPRRHGHVGTRDDGLEPHLHTH